MLKRTITLCGAGAAALAVAASAAAVPTGPASASADRERLQRDTDAIRDAGTTGVLAEVSTGGRTLRARSGVADLRTRGPVPWDAYYRVGSDTKTFVATVVLQLAAEGRIRLTDTVGHWLPGVVAGHGNDGSKITVRDLLRQTSGVYDYSAYLPQDQDHSPESYRRYRFRSYTPARLVAMAMRHAPVFEPGARWEYSNTNYILAGMIVEKATGNPWEHEVHERIIAPLGLDHTMISGTSAYAPRPRATFYQRFEPGGPLVDVSIQADGYADGGVISTGADMNRFHRALLGGRLLRPAQLAEMRRTVPARDWRIVYKDAEYGLGLAKRRLGCGTWAWFHGGSMAGVSSVNSVSPDGRTAVQIMIPTTPATTEDRLKQFKAANALMDHVLC
ncbi:MULTISPECIES: serine hydrolase domain-containing protein [Actinomadura]|uniref:Serine hydrolase domain-containing protein n=1 Tax=Actinomadura yumaensis TaxID=111807 RepID=A0ABW2CNH7_9ACTN|nr:serine hydrolase domain-containing protein [Actinomadura sp. J1-007]